VMIRHSERSEESTVFYRTRMYDNLKKIAYKKLNNKNYGSGNLKFDLRRIV
jgi:hypothetical protein